MTARPRDASLTWTTHTRQRQRSHRAVQTRLCGHGYFDKQISHLPAMAKNACFVMFLAAGICGNMINRGPSSIRHATTASTQRQTVASERPNTSPTTSKYVPQAKKRSAAHNLMTAGMAKVLSVAGSSLFPMMASSWVI